MTTLPTSAKRRWPIALGFMVGVALLSAGLLWPDSRIGQWLIRSSYDGSQKTARPEMLSAAPVVLVYLDLDSYLREKQNPAEPWSRALHARLVRRLTEAGARAVVFDIIFERPGADAAADQELTDAIRANGRVVLAAELSRSSRATANAAGVEAAQLILPTASFRDAAAAWGLANAQVDDDFVVRQLFRGFPDQQQPSLTWAAAKVAGFDTARVSNATAWLRYYGPGLALPHISYSSALNRAEVGDEIFRDKIVLVGARPMAGSIRERKDEFRTPLSGWGDKNLFMPAVEVHATQLLNLARGDYLLRLSPLLELLVVTLSVLTFGLVLFSLRPLSATAFALVGTAAVYANTTGVLPARNLWFPWMIVCGVQIPGLLIGSVVYQSIEWYRQRRRLEAQRRADETRIREQATLIERAQDAILVLTPSGEINYANPSAEKLFGAKASELASTPGFAVLKGEFSVALAEALKAGEWQGQLHPQNVAGKTLTLESRATLIRDESGNAKTILLVNTDVTEQRQLEAEALRSQRMESLGALAGGMVHDLNNALAPVLMGLQMLQRERQDAESRRMLAVMESNTHRGADMVKQVLLFARGDTGERQPVQLGHILGEIEQIIRSTFPKTIDVAALIPADLWSVLGNPTQIHQVVLNLCVNARDAMSPGGKLTLAADNVELTPAEADQIPGGRAGRFVMVLVADTGTGIPPEILPRIFEPFFTTKPIGVGTGLGLSSSTRIVKQHDGFMNVRSELGQGATFEVYLPIASSPDLPRVAIASEQKAPEGRSELILLVDDELAMQEMLTTALTSHGYRVLAASNGAEALRLLEQDRAGIRLVLLDKDMPVLNGESTSQSIRARWPKTPVALMSGDVLLAKGASASAARVPRIQKPFTVHQLMVFVRAAIDERTI